MLDTIAKNLNLKVPVVQLSKYAVNNNVDTDTVAQNTTGESECIIETTKNFQTFPTEVINIEKLTKQNDTLDKNLSTELRNEFISNVMSNYNLCINTSENLSLEIPDVPLNKDIVNDNVDMHIVARNAIDESECIIDTIENFQTLPTEIINIEELTKQNDKFDKNISTELLPNESASNVTLQEYNLCINTSENLSLEIPDVPLNKDIVNDNVDMHIVARNAIDESECIIDTIENFQTLPTEIINIEELTKQNDKFDKNISTELLPNESASNVTLQEYNLCINTSENLSLEIPDVPLNKDIVNDNVDTHTVVRNESTSDVMLPEYNLYKDILNQFEKKDTNNNSTSDNNFDRTVMFSFEELHDLDISLNNVIAV
ncbi:uncharacterized protein LOC115232950 isoform X2 [Formica exsecta]|nr:uncharacterized protein LOC115232950 isoform X2 [Formica exsecta]XP_029658991.1 uncharacterized protein LOC115232950 isoform X2 [Formica exsecta]XP_029658993.1 uncharacterized protein LOC115232950 isoform X2 [Formica exsecta]